MRRDYIIAGASIYLATALALGVAGYGLAVNVANSADREELTQEEMTREAQRQAQELAARIREEDRRAANGGLVIDGHYGGAASGNSGKPGDR